MHDWRTKPEAYDKYAFLIKNAWSVRVLYAAGLLSWLGVMYGYGLFLGLEPWYWIVFGPILAVISLFHALNYGIGLFFRRFDVKKHERAVRAYWNGLKTLPTVDIYLPVCGESLGMLEWTFAAVQAINYPNKKVHVLDDRGDADTSRLAAKMGFSYLSRPDKGTMKKAGNLRYAHGRTDGEFIVIFDADFAPHPDFIIDLLPYMADPKTAIVQSPQYFQTDGKVHRRSPLEYGAGHVQEDFYRIVQPARDTFGGAICVGSNAIYRRSALDAVGGTAQVEHSEDVLTGFNLIAAGYRIKYVPLVLAQGLCPESVHAYFHQQHRWCSGTMRLCTSKRFLAAPITWGQKLSYFSGLLYYVTHALSLALAFQVYIVLLFHFDMITLRNALPFVPHLLFTFIALPLFRRGAHRFGTSLARVAQTFSCSHAVFTHMLGRGLDWHPTNSKKGSAGFPFVALVSFNGAYLLANAGFIAFAVAQGKFPIFELQYYSVMFWVLYNMLTATLFLLYGRRTLKEYVKNDPTGNRPAAHGLRFVSVCAALSVITVGAGALRAGERQVLPVAAVPAMAAEAPAAVAAAPTPQASVQRSCAYAAEPGDSLTVLVRRAVGAFLRDSERTLDAPRKIFVETAIVRDKGAGPIEIGEIIVTSAEEIAPRVADSMGLTPSQLDAWADYASAVRFD